MEFSAFVAYFATIYAVFTLKIVSCFPGQQKLKIQPAHVNVMVGERVQANCTIDNMNSPYSLRWKASGKQEHEVKFQQLKVNSRTTMLQIQEAGPGDSGFYRCILTDSEGNITIKTLQIIVHNIDHASTLTSCDFKFWCDEDIPIFCRYLCDGIKNCENGADEIHCSNDICAGKFRCNNSKCIDEVHVCDMEGNNDCGDWSDEDKCSGITENYPKDNESVDDQMTWLKTTVYTVIACTVGVVLFISIVVIAIFRIKMKRAAVRRAIRQAERRRRHGHHCEGHGGHQSSRAQRNNAVEHEPFISAPSPTHFGNIIVNVNNGVQYVPNSDFNSILQAPPSYSEVLAESRLEEPGRHSPPPEYSTIDRNPNRLSEVTDLEIQNLSQRAEENRSAPAAASRIAGSDSSNMQLFEARADNSVESNSANVTPSMSPSISLPTGCTNSLGRRSSHNRHSRNVRSVASPRRPKQLQVRDGQIVLDGNSSNSSSPETVNRNTQTNLADITPTGQNSAKPSHLQVQGGNIILTNQETEEPVTSDSESVAIAIEGASSARGQLEVKDGQIVFKAS